MQLNYSILVEMPHLEGYKNLTICSIKYNINLLPLYDQMQNEIKPSFLEKILFLTYKKLNLGPLV